MTGREKFVTMHAVKQLCADSGAGKTWDERYTAAENKFKKLMATTDMPERTRKAKEPAVTRKTYLMALVSVARNSLATAEIAIKPLIGKAEAVGGITLDEFNWIMEEAAE